MLSYMATGQAVHGQHRESYVAGCDQEGEERTRDDHLFARSCAADEYDYTSGGEHDPSGGAGPSGTGFHPSWGNYGADSGGECSVPMVHRWHGTKTKSWRCLDVVGFIHTLSLSLSLFLRSQAPATGNGIFWYSFDYAGIHVVQMSTEHNWTRGSEQFEWLKADLLRVNRSATPWVILTAHRMMVSVARGACDSA